jgi:riboflavin synthase
MFTGLVEESGEVIGLEAQQGGGRLRLRAPKLGPAARLGDSIAVNGCCLTVSERTEDVLVFDLLAETLRLTNLGTLQPGELVNLEPALAAGGRLGGHFVQGHIDGTAQVLAFEPHGNDHRLEISLPPGSAQYVVYKGSIAVNGISLTVAEVKPESFVLWIIPHTLAMTNLGGCAAGSVVNLEFDLLAKYLERLLAVRSQSA